MLRVPNPRFPPQEIELSKVRVRSIDQQRSFLLLLLATVTLLLAAFVGAAVAYAQDAEEPIESPAAAEAVPDAAMEAGGIDGTWTVDTEIGDFEDFSGSWVGFRVAEVLERFGDAEAVGRTRSSTASSWSMAAPSSRPPSKRT